MVNLLRVWLAVFALLFMVESGKAEVLLQDPQIPDGERIVYNFCVGDSSGTLVEEVRIKEENNCQIYEIVSRSKFVDKEAKIIKKDMTLVYLSTVNKRKKTVIERTTALIEDKSETKKAGIKMLDYNGLNYILRGFPFTEKKPLKIRTIGGRGMFPMKVKVGKTKNITVGDKSIKCYKLELGVTGLLGVIFPKSLLWYSVDPPHYLVRSKSPKAAGYPKRTIELIEYSVK